MASSEVKVSFRVAGADEVAKAFEGITRGAQRQAGAVARASQVTARAQNDGAQQAVATSRAAKNAMLSDAEALARAEIAIIQRLNRARVDAAKTQVKLAQDAGAAQERVMAAQERAARASNRRRAAGEIGSGAASGFKAGAAFIGGAVGFNAMQSVRDQMSLEERAALLRNASGKNKAQFDSVGLAKKISNTIGVSASDVMTGFEGLSGKAGGGGLTEYMNQYEELAKLARGAGVSTANLGDMLGTLYNRGIKSKDVVKVMEALTQQTKDGAVEMDQFSTQLDASSGALGRFKMSEAERVMTAGGLTQLARTFGRKSAEESTTAVTDLASELSAKGDIVQKLTGGTLTRVMTKGTKTKKMVNGRMVETEVGGGTRDQFAGGVEVGTTADRTEIRDINKILPELIEGAAKAGNIGKLMGAGGVFSGTSMAIAGPLIQAFSQGIKKNAEGRYQLTGEGEKADLTGRGAVDALLKQFQSADVAAGTSEKAFAEVMGTSQAKLNRSIEQLRNDLGTRLAPIAQDAINNPKTAAAAVLAATTALGAGNVVAGKLGGAVLDKIFPKSVASMTVTAASVVVSGGAPGVPPVPGVGGGAAPGSTVAKAGMLATGAAIGAIGATAYGYYQGGQLVSEDTDRIAKGAPASDLARKIATGNGVSEADRERGAVMAKQNEMMQGGFFSRMAGSALATVDQVKQDGFSAASVGRILTSPFSMVSGASKAGEAPAQAAIKSSGEELKAALAGQPLRLAEGSSVTMANVGALASAVGAAVGTAVGASGLQQPKAQLP